MLNGMEETAAKPPQPAAAQPAHAPVMDVVARPAAAAPAPAAKPEPETVAVRPEPLTKDPDEKEKPAEAKKEAAKPEEKPKKPVAPKQHGNGVGAAIFATMVIVLGLAAMATYAYMKTQN
jgi:hypothetical protein